ncbi:MAG: hypothetical protein JSR82_21630 [Verrucomicrobia bacterium]|nr:hypothetical protein [Verrucomicrobiota bacterium]
MSPGLLRHFAFALSVVSGAAGLAHQLLWVRRLVDLLGAEAGVFSRVTGAFFLGLALGAWWAARRPTPRPWRAVAAAELLIAALAALVLLAAALPPPPGNSLLAWLLPLLLVTPPAAAMGLVVPWMIRAIGREQATTLYALNTLGGIGGLLFVSLWALPSLGLAGASQVVLGLNLLVAALAALLPTPAMARTDDAPTAAPVVSAEPASEAPLLCALAFVSGMLVLGAEVVLQHQLAQFLVSSHFASGATLVFVLLALSAAALLVPRLARLRTRALPTALLLAALGTATQPFLLHTLRGRLNYLDFQQPLPGYLAEAAFLGLPALGIALLPAGLLFPLVLRRGLAGGIEAGRLLAWNGLGGWLGAELAERLLFPLGGLWLSLVGIGAGYACALMLRPQGWRWALALPTLLLLAPLGWRAAHLPSVGLARGDRVEALATGREGVAAVLRGAPDDLRIVLNNTYTLGGSRAQVNQERQTLLPMLLHGEARRVATLGVATGSSLAGATLDPLLEAAEGIDLSALVLSFAAEQFAGFNRQVARDPRVRLTHGDARRVIRERPGQFDVIAGDLFLPWGTGEGRLFCREHFEAVRRALQPDGLYCQWLPLYQITRPQADAIFRTFRAVFPEAWVVRGDFYAGMPIIGLVGGRGMERLDWKRIAAATARVRVHGGCRDPLLRHAEGVALLVAGTLPEPPPGPVITLANAWIEWDAAYNVIGLRQPWFSGTALGEYLRLLSRQGAELLPAELRPAQRLGDLFLTLEVARAANLALAPALEAEVLQALPETLRDDPGADWSRFPMRHRPARFGAGGTTGPTPFPSQTANP